MSISKQEWLDKISHWKKIWPQTGLPEYEDDSRGINLYKFIEVFNQNLKYDSCIVSDAGSALYIPCQSLQLSGNQRHVLDSSQASMGGWQACIGVALARNNNEVLVLTGDGSLMTGIESLAVIRYNNLNIKIFIWNNLGYLSIKNTQNAFFGGRHFGTDTKTGLFFPSFEKIADSYGFDFIKISKNNKLDQGIKNALSTNNPTLIEILCDPDQKIIPSLALKDGKSCTLDDMAPFLPEEIIEKETIKD